MRRILTTSVLLTILLATTDVQAQQLKPSELRKKQQSEQRSADIFGEEESGFTRTEIPEKWKNESAVVLFSKMDYSYLRDNDMLLVKETLRKRIKLLDQAALDNFSEFYYRNAEAIGIRIVKADGTELEVDLSDAVEVSTEVPSFFRPYYRYNNSYYKLAIPNLEKGDIIDYHYSSLDKHMNYGYEISFSPFLFTLNGTYPSMGQKLSFSVDRGFYINFGTYYGAPKFTEGEAGTDSRGRQKAFIKTYELEDGERDRQSDIRWHNPYFSNPYVKFQVIYVSPRYAKYSAYMLGEIGEVKSSITANEVVNKINDIVFSKTLRLTPYEYEVEPYLRRYHRKETDTRKICQEAYQLLRYELLKNYFFAYPDRYDNLDYDDISADNHRYINSMYHLLNEKGIRTEIVVAMPTTLGNIKDVLLADELSIGLRINGKDGFYLFHLSNHTAYDHMAPYLEGAQAYVFTPNKRGNIERWEEILLPEKTSEFHHQLITRQMSVHDDLSGLTMTSNTKLFGAMKSGYNQIALHGFDYVKEDKEKLYPDSEEEEKRGNSRRAAERQKREAAAHQKKLEKQKEVFQALATNELPVNEYASYKLVQSGRFATDVPLEFEEQLTLDGLISKAGKNYLFEIGKLMSTQVMLEEKERIRDEHIYLSHAKSFTYKVTISIPKGMGVKGLEDLNVEIDNEAGKFSSIAKVEGDKILFETTKMYKRKFLPQDDWHQMADFLDAAYSVSQKKILLIQNMQSKL